MKYLYILSRLTVGRWRTACPWGWGNENENCHSDAALPKSDLQIPKALQFWICRFFHAVGITVIAATIRIWSWRTICTWSWRTAPDAMVKPPRSFVFSTFLSGRRSGGTWGAFAVRSIFICHSNVSAMAPTTLRPITFKRGVPTFHQVWCAWCSFSPKKCHANALENEVYCLLHCPVSSKCCSCHNFPQKCDVNVLEYEVYCLLRSHCFFKYCACHISSQKCAVNALDFEGDCFLRSHGFFSKDLSCYNAIGAEFLVAYYCAVGARKFLQQKPVLPSTAPVTVLLGQSFW